MVLVKFTFKLESFGSSTGSTRGSTRGLLTTEIGSRYGSTGTLCVSRSEYLMGLCAIDCGIILILPVNAP